MVEISGEMYKMQGYFGHKIYHNSLLSGTTQAHCRKQLTLSQGSTGSDAGCVSGEPWHMYNLRRGHTSAVVDRCVAKFEQSP